MGHHTRPDVLICDVGDTLIRWNHYSREDGLSALKPLIDHPDRFDMDRLVNTGVAQDDTIEPRAAESLLEYRQADFLRLLFARGGMTLLCDDDHLEWHYWRGALGFEPEPGVHAALTRLQELEVRLAIVSNTAFGPRSILGELERHDLARFFETPVITSARFAVRKPNPAILDAARGLFVGPREEGWYIGNSVYHDVGGANAAGLPVIWYNEDGESLAEVATNGETPDHEVASWAGVVELLESLPARDRGDVA